MEINQGGTVRDSAFLKRKRVIFRQEEAILNQAERKGERERSTSLQFESREVHWSAPEFAI